MQIIAVRERDLRSSIKICTGNAQLYTYLYDDLSARSRSCESFFILKGAIPMKRITAIILATILALTLFAGCTTEQEKSGALKLTDMTGREVVLDKPAERIVALMPADCEILYALGAGDTLVGRGEYCNYPAEISGVPAVQSGNETNIEQIIALDPDVIIMSKMGQTVEQVEALSNAGIEVFVSDAQSIADIYTTIELIGKLTGKDAKATEIANDMKAAFDKIKTDSAAKAQNKTIYFETSPLEWGLWTAGKGTFMQEIADMLCVKNIFDDVNGWAEVSAEQVISRNPDYIITTAMYFGSGPLPDEEVKGRTGWGGISAVANNGVFNANSDELTIPSVRLVDGAQSLYNFIYGE